MTDEGSEDDAVGGGVEDRDEVSADAKTYECDSCGNRLKADHHPMECPNCGGEMFDIEASRE